MQKIRYRLFHFWFLLSRPMTLGVRLLVQNDANEILLVRHTYVPGWHLPGGGVDNGRTAEEAARKELEEEAYLRATGPLKLISVHANHKASKRDHVLVFHCSDWEVIKPFKPNREIAEIGFFPIDQLPNETTNGTRARLDEFHGTSDISPYW